MWTAWCFTTNLCEPYLSRYSMNEMGLNFTQMTVFGTVAASVGTLLVMRRWGAVLDKSGGRTVMLVAALAASLSNAFYLFSTGAEATWRRTACSFHWPLKKGRHPISHSFPV